ncbi:PREDICTED: serpin B13 [Chrysochloris asiatica]|uniref:Serpin B13 n=1 Tax=Chrysochloris asiatica TaxID=185453 RepID=A0A9B0T674_CHRAS|nr:PREDICTED: serpin B13 [Chrysochloris asiatica]
MNSLGTANTRFGIDLLKELKKTSDDNIFFSPVSISTAIGMILLGARGSTAHQLRKVFYSEKDTESSEESSEEKEAIEATEEIHQQLQKFLAEINKPTNDYELNIANRLFGEKTYLFLQKYLDYVEKYYHAAMDPVDFVNAADESRKKINSWVERETNEKIKDLLPDGSVSSSTRLILVNTVCFQGKWDSEFKKENTKEEKFWLNKSTSKSVLMMKQRHSFNFTFLEDLQAKILGIPYKNNDLCMFLLLPNDIDGLEKIVDKITPEDLIEWTSPGHMTERTVSVCLPRFQVENTYDLEDTLGAMGLADAFSEDQADYSGMSATSRLHTQKLLHTSLMEVTEDGTEAAAGTGVGSGITSAPNDENFHCNHPFLFFIRHNASDSVLFFGRLSSP